MLRRFLVVAEEATGVDGAKQGRRNRRRASILVIVVEGIELGWFLGIWKRGFNSIQMFELILGLGFIDQREREREGLGTWAVWLYDQSRGI